MGEPQVKTPVGRKGLKIILRLLVIVFLAAGVGTVLNRTAIALDDASRPAGFVRGLLQGALMPMSLPNLMVGRDVIIYSQNNTGVTYKLGYTAGVNVCGLFFFGLLFWRLRRLPFFSREK